MQKVKEISRELLRSNPLLWLKYGDRVAFKTDDDIWAESKTWEPHGTVHSIYEQEGDWYVDVCADGKKVNPFNVNNYCSVVLFAQ